MVKAKNRREALFPFSMVRDAGLSVGVSAFTTGDTIDITVVFSAAVVVEGVPTLS